VERSRERSDERLRKKYRLEVYEGFKVIIYKLFEAWKVDWS